jgi:hypothetical protein
LVPALIVAFWGGSYIWLNFMRLTAPGVPVLFQVQTEGGPLAVRAETFNFDVDQAVLRATQVTVVMPSGELLASAGYVVARIPTPFHPQNPAIDIRVRNVAARVVRLPTGEIDVLRFLPEEREPVVGRAFHVVVESADLDLLDLAGATPFRRQVFLPRTVVSGLGEAWLARGDAAVEGVGTTSIELRRDPARGVRVFGWTAGLQVAELIAHLSTTPEAANAQFLREFSARTFSIAGPFELIFSAEGPASWHAEITASGTGLRFRQYVAESANLTGILGETGFQGRAQVQTRGTNANFRGALVWRPELRVAGWLSTALPSSVQLQPGLAELLPQGTAFHGATYNGWLSYDAQQGPRLTGALTADQIAWAEETFNFVVADLNFAGNQFLVHVDQMRWNDIPLREAFLSFDSGTRELAGFAWARSLTLPQTAARFGLDNVAGQLDVEAVLGGTADAPLVDFRATGRGVAIRAAGQRLDLGQVDVVATLRDRNLVVERGLVQSPGGAMTVTGLYALDTGRIDGQIFGSALDLAALNPDLDGIVILEARATGTAAQPRLVGRVEGYGLEIANQSLPMLQANIDLDRQRLLATDVVAFRGAGRGEGWLAWRFADDALQGQLDAVNVQLGDLLDERVAGAVNLVAVQIGGTIKQPEVRGGITAGEIIALGMPVEGLTGDAELVGNVIKLRDGTFNVAGGTVHADLTYDLAREQGTIAGRAVGVQLEQLVPEVALQARLQGAVTADFRGRIAGTALEALTADGTIEDTRLNLAEFGRGVWTLETDGRRWIATAEVGLLERYIQLSRAVYDPVTETIDAQLETFAVSLEDLYRAAQPFVGDLPEPVDLRLRTLDGDLNMALALSGPARNPDVDLTTFEIANLEVQGEASGRVTAAATRRGGVWDIDHLAWTNPPGLFTLSGTLDENGQADLEGLIRNFRASWLEVFYPGFGPMQDTVDVDFTVAGPTLAPTLDASVTARLVVEQTVEGEPVLETVRSLSLVTRVESGTLTPTGARVGGGITADGPYFYRGFTGRVSAALPFQFPFTIPQDEPIDVRVTLPPRELDALAAYFPMIDPARTEGTISALLRVNGTLAEPAVGGDASLEASSMAMHGIEMTLQQLRANAQLLDNDVVVRMQSESSQGGTLSGQLTTTIEGFEQALEGGLEAILTNNVQGAFTLTEFGLLHRAGDRGSISGEIEGGLKVSGTLGQPLIAGNLVLRDASGIVPAVFPEEREGRPPLVNPRFDITMAIEDTANVRALNSTLELSGDGRLSGTLTNPQVFADMAIQSGYVRLPNARIQVEPGGTARLTYQGDRFADAAARLDVDLEGRTTLVAARFGDIELYNITLEMRGNVLEEGAVFFTATADPPDLSQERILALLGQAELIEAFAGAFRTGFDRTLQTAVTQVALPVLFDPVTERIAEALGLQYLSLEYNAFEQTSIVFARTFGRNLVLQGRRQITDPPPGQRHRYDLRLTYRLPTRLRHLDRVMFSIGIDQDRPWKLAIEYRRRF